MLLWDGIGYIVSILSHVYKDRHMRIYIYETIKREREFRDISYDKFIDIFILPETCYILYFYSHHKIM